MKMLRIRLSTLLLCVMMAAFAPAQAQTSSYAPVVRKAAPAVVNIYTKRVVRERVALSPFANDPMFRQFFGGQMPGAVREKVERSLGSGVIIKPDGLVVTSNHVVKDAQAIIVVLPDKREFEAEISIQDSTTDLAFLRLKGASALPTLPLRDSDTLEVGDVVLAIGNPFGIGQTVTTGIVSALSRAATGVSDYQFFIQTDAAINPGNSGGALVDMEGKLIGINTAIYSTSGGSNGIGFAIPSNMVKALMGSKVSKGGKVVRPWLGLAVQPVTSEIAQSLGMDKPRGALVKDVAADSAAERSGLKPGDVLLAVDGSETSDSGSLSYRLALKNVGETATFTVLRNGQQMDIAVALEAAPETVKRDTRTLKGAHPLDGATVANLSPALAQELNLPEDASGVIVLIGGQGGFVQPGDIILQVGKQRIKTVADLESALKPKVRAWQIAIRRGDGVITLNVQL